MELAEELIGFETESPIQDPEIFEFVRMYLQGKEIEARIIDNDGVKSLMAETGSGEPQICLSGHLDVVRPGEGWQVTEPYSPRIEDGKLYGRGAADMKAAAAALINAFVRLNRSEAEGSVTLMLTGDEELGGERGTERLTDENEFDYAIVGEPTDLNIQVGTRGVMWLDIVVKGDSHHASRVSSEQNVMREVPEVVTALNEMEMTFTSDNVLPDPTAAVTSIEADETYNSTPSAVRIGMDVRYISGQSPETVIEDVKGALDSTGADFRVELKGDFAKPTKLKDEEFRKKSEDAVENVTGKKPECITGGGASDGRFFYRNGTPFIELGLDQEPVHTQDEYCSLDDLELLSDIYHDLCKRLMNG